MGFVRIGDDGVSLEYLVKVGRVQKGYRKAGIGHSILRQVVRMGTFGGVYI